MMVGLGASLVYVRDYALPSPYASTACQSPAPLLRLSLMPMRQAHGSPGDYVDRNFLADCAPSQPCIWVGTVTWGKLPACHPEPNACMHDEFAKPTKKPTH
jgi:hypothetical protein